MKNRLLILSALIATIVPLAAEPAAKPLKALLVIGGCCHDYAVQKDILKAGIEERTHIQVDVCYSDQKNTKTTFTCYERDNWADGYDVIIHDECSADVKDPVVVNRILDPLAPDHKVSTLRRVAQALDKRLEVALQ